LVTYLEELDYIYDVALSDDGERAQELRKKKNKYSESMKQQVCDYRTKYRAVDQSLNALLRPANSSLPPAGPVIEDDFTDSDDSEGQRFRRVVMKLAAEVPITSLSDGDLLTRVFLRERKLHSFERQYNQELEGRVVGLRRFATQIRDKNKLATAARIPTSISDLELRSEELGPTEFGPVSSVEIDELMPTNMSDVEMAVANVDELNARREQWEALLRRVTEGWESVFETAQQQLEERMTVRNRVVEEKHGCRGELDIVDPVCSGYGGSG